MNPPPLSTESSIGGQLLNTTIMGTDFSRSKINGLKIIGSFATSDSDVGQITLRASKGDRILYTSGPGKNGQSIYIAGHEHQFINSLPISEKWTVLEFNNPNLPDTFEIIINDYGTKWGEWSAVAVGM